MRHGRARPTAAVAGGAAARCMPLNGFRHKLFFFAGLWAQEARALDARTRPKRKTLAHQLRDGAVRR